ncbi:MAG: adenosine deaminase [Micrococcales bacterium]|nr:adenosine deaminase [Micrococcales bacterium]
MTSQTDSCESPDGSCEVPVAEEGCRDLLAAVGVLPKVLLHDHLDGGVRPATLVDLAARAEQPLPTTDPDELGAWFRAAASSGSLERYLETFAYPVGVMQTADALHRVAREAVEDLADDGVVYAESRFAPEQHTARGLSMAQVVEAVLAGFDEGMRAAAARGRTIAVRALLVAMRQFDHWGRVAELAVTYRDRGVVGFDLAGPEAGFPADRDAAAFARARDAWLPVTVHAGEADGLESIAAALRMGARRLGHGLRIADDIDGDRLGPLAHWVRDRRIALEICPTSNVHTGGAGSIAEHPVTHLHRLGFAVTVNTDNRLQSGTSMSAEFASLVGQAGWTLADLRQVTVTAAHHAFVHEDARTALIDEIIVPGYRRAGGGRHQV